jgi:hypothetical protein
LIEIGAAIGEGPRVSAVSAAFTRLSRGGAVRGATVTGASDGRGARGTRRAVPSAILLTAAAETHAERAIVDRTSRERERSAQQKQRAANRARIAVE